MRTRRAVVTLMLLAGGLSVGATALASSATADLGADGIGTVTFGAPKAKVVDVLSVQFGAPTWRGINSGCGPRWTEVEWNDLAAEFRDGSFSGYRYARNVHGLFTQTQTQNQALRPRLATAKRISLGSTLAEVRAVYTLHLAGAGRWHSHNGIVFVSDAQHSPAPLSSRIIEIKSPSTCGDF